VPTLQGHWVWAVEQTSVFVVMPRWAGPFGSDVEEESWSPESWGPESRGEETPPRQAILDRFVELRAARERVSLPRVVAEQRVAEQRVAEQRVAEQRAAEQRVAEQRAAEQRVAEQRAAEQRAAVVPFQRRKPLARASRGLFSARNEDNRSSARGRGRETRCDRRTFDKSTSGTPIRSFL
jgi:hypothetical protein